MNNRTFPYARAHDTVGAVALDNAGNVACATSTGGIRNKMVGRVGDSPVIGMTFSHALHSSTYISVRNNQQKAVLTLTLIVRVLSCKAVEDMPTTLAVRYRAPATENRFLRSLLPDSFFQKLNKVKCHAFKCSIRTHPFLIFYFSILS